MTEQLSPRVESGQGETMWELADFVSDQADDTALDFGRRIKRVFVHGEEVLDVVVRLRNTSRCRTSWSLALRPRARRLLWNITHSGTRSRQSSTPNRICELML